MKIAKKSGQFANAEELRAYLKSSGICLDIADDGAREAMSRPAELFGRKLSNRWAVLPMEGWDCSADGTPSELTLRRWRNFASGGAGLIYGTEAGAVMHSGRSNPKQLLVSERTAGKLTEAVRMMREAHSRACGGEIAIGLQLTHSGRFSHPDRPDKLESVVAYNHPLLDIKYGVGRVVQDSEIPGIVEHYAAAACVAQAAGFDFVDVKLAHGYLAHEFLSAVDRPGPYGGSFENRTRFYREIVERIKKRCPGLNISSRLSIFDIMPFVKGSDGVGVPMGWEAGKRYPYAFGGDGSGLDMDPDLDEPVRLAEMMRGLGVDFVCGTIGSPYYNVHMQRPAYFPVCDGYEPPQDPLYNVARHVKAAGRLKERCPWLGVVLSGITCLQEYAANAAEAAVASGKADFAGIGRMVLPYSDYPSDHLNGKKFDRRRICRTIGDCTNAPRNGIVSGCFPLDPFYRGLPECAQLRSAKEKMRGAAAQ